MRADADFMVYVAARWPALVRQSVLLGVTPADAADATVDALSRCRRSWGRASRDEDVDALVQDELVRAAARRPRTDDASREQAASELLVLAPPTLEDVRQRERDNSRAVLRRAAVMVVPVLLVAAGAGAYFATAGSPAQQPPRDDKLNAAPRTFEENPAPGVVWYADGQLHLDHEVLAIQGLTDMTRIGTGVVYGDQDGRVVYAAVDGHRSVLGHKDPHVPVAASGPTGWAAWVDTTKPKPVLLVVEASSGHRVDQIPVDPSARVVAVDDTSVFFTDDHGTYVLSPASYTGLAVVGSDSELLDVRSRTTVYQADPKHVTVLRPDLHVTFRLPGRGGSLSPDGTLVATHPTWTDGRVTVFATSDGHQLPDGLTEDDDVLAVQPGDNSTIAYVVAANGLRPGSELQLRTCDLTTTYCKIAARIDNATDTPVLAR